MAEVLQNLFRVFTQQALDTALYNDSSLILLIYDAIKVSLIIYP